MQTHKATRRITLYALVAIVALALVSCGSAAEPTTAPVATSAPAAPTSAPAMQDTPTPSGTSIAPIPAAAATQEASAPTAMPMPTEPPSEMVHVPTGTLTISEFEFDTESWLPWEDTNQQFYWARVMEQLVRLNPSTWQIEPGLAHNWNLSEDGRTVTYNLEQGVPFHEDYGEFTSEDVVFSLNQWLFHETSVHPSVAAMRQADPEVRAVDKYTAEVEFRATPFLTALMDLSSGNNGVGMMSKAYFDEVGFDAARRKGIGTGPYTFVEHRLGESITLEALDEHWRIVPQWKELKILVTLEPSTRLAQVLSGEADIALLPGSFKRQTEAAKIRTLLNPGVAGVFLVPVVYIPGTTGIDAPDPNNPMADPKFREALSLAVNRQEIADVVFAGGAVPTGVTDLSPISLGYDPKWETPDPYDPDRAMQLLEESGKAGLSIEFQQRALGGIPEGPQLAEAIAGMWEGVGLDVDLKLNLQTSQHSDLRRTRGLEGKIWMMRLGHLTDTTRRLVSQYRCTEEETALFACNSDLEELAPSILQSTDLEEKNELIRQAYDIILSNRVVIPVVQTATLYAIGDQVGEWHPRLGERFTTELEKVGHAR